MKTHVRLKHFILFCGIMVVTLGLASVVFASPIVDVELIDVGSSVPYNGVYAGFYTLTIDGVEVPAVCDDYNTHVSVGLTWQAVIYSYQDIEDGTANTKFSDPDKYSQIGWLFSQMFSADPNSQARYQAAIWNIMAPGAITMDAEAQAYYDAAMAYSDFDYTHIMQVLTPDPHSASQEYLIPSTTPEPGTFILLGAGLLGLVALGNKRRLSLGPSQEEQKTPPYVC